MSLPPGVRSIIIKPKWRKRMVSWGLEWPLQCGEIRGFGGWAVWNKWTGRVIHWLPERTNTHGYSFARRDAMLLSQPKHDPAINWLHDMEN